MTNRSNVLRPRHCRYCNRLMRPSRTAKHCGKAPCRLRHAKERLKACRLNGLELDQVLEEFEFNDIPFGKGHT